MFATVSYFELTVALLQNVGHFQRQRRAGLYLTLKKCLFILEEADAFIVGFYYFMFDSKYGLEQGEIGRNQVFGKRSPAVFWEGSFLALNSRK